jgi:hypothetical protein
MAFLAPFIPEHLDRMDVKDGDAYTVVQNYDVADTLSRIGAKTILTNNQGIVLGIMGAVPLVPGVCEVFILASKQQVEHPVAFARCAHREISLLCSKYRRIEAKTANDEFHRRWITWLGFEQEGILKRYGMNGEDMVLWSLT